VWAAPGKQPAHTRVSSARSAVLTPTYGKSNAGARPRRAVQPERHLPVQQHVLLPERLRDVRAAGHHQRLRDQRGDRRQQARARAARLPACAGLHRVFTGFARARVSWAGAWRHQPLLVDCALKQSQVSSCASRLCLHAVAAPVHACRRGRPIRRPTASRTNAARGSARARSCGYCNFQCQTATDVCCSGVCADLQTSSTNCGQCGFFCVSLPNVQARGRAGPFRPCQTSAAAGAPGAGPEQRQERSAVCPPADRSPASAAASHGSAACGSHAPTELRMGGSLPGRLPQPG